jgi:rubredoxin
MFFKRKYKSGGADYDPRQRVWAEFVCSNCGHIEDIDISGGKEATFIFDQERLCPKCHTYNSDDYKKNLQAEIEKLTLSKRNIEVQIEECIRKMDESESKEIEK